MHPLLRPEHVAHIATLIEPFPLQNHVRRLRQKPGATAFSRARLIPKPRPYRRRVVSIFSNEAALVLPDLSIAIDGPQRARDLAG